MNFKGMLLPLLLLVSLLSFMKVARAQNQDFQKAECETILKKSVELYDKQYASELSALVRMRHSISDQMRFLSAHDREVIMNMATELSNKPYRNDVKPGAVVSKEVMSILEKMFFNAKEETVAIGPMRGTNLPDPAESIDGWVSIPSNFRYPQSGFSLGIHIQTSAHSPISGAFRVELSDQISVLNNDYHLADELNLPEDMRNMEVCDMGAGNTCSSLPFTINFYRAAGSWACASRLGKQLSDEADIQLKAYQKSQTHRSR